jgi:hypothetical protein
MPPARRSSEIYAALINRPDIRFYDSSKWDASTAVPDDITNGLFKPAFCGKRECMQWRRWRWAAVALVSSNLSGCFRSASVMPNELEKFDAANSSGQPVVVRTQSGDYREIDELDSAIVFAKPKCTECPARIDKFKYPFTAKEYYGELSIADNRLTRAYSVKDVESITLRKFSAERSVLVVGTAIFVGGLVAMGSATLCREASHCDPAGTALLGGILAAPLTLTFTIPLTKPLGEPVHEH